MAQYNNYIVITMDIDGMVPWHHAISNHSVDYTAMRFQLFMG